MNDLTRPPLKDSTAPIVAGSVWELLPSGPWATERPTRVKIIDAREGWVRYSMGQIFNDERLSEDSFRKCYAPTNEYATGALLKVPVPRDELEGALADMLLSFHYREGNFATRDAAVRRAQLALGSQVTL